MLSTVSTWNFFKILKQYRHSQVDNICIWSTKRNKSIKRASYLYRQFFNFSTIFVSLYNFFNRQLPHMLMIPGKCVLIKSIYFVDIYIYGILTSLTPRAEIWRCLTASYVTQIKDSDDRSKLCIYVYTK